MGDGRWCPWCGSGSHKVDMAATPALFTCTSCGFEGPEATCIHASDPPIELQEKYLKKKHQKGSISGEGLASIIVLIIIVLCLAMKPACQPTRGEVIRAAEDQGWSDIKIEDESIYFVSWKGCSGSDSFAYHAVATNPVGKKVHVTICAGNTVTSKGVTMRTQ
jgi:hypothetical protein